MALAVRVLSVLLLAAALVTPALRWRRAAFAGFVVLGLVTFALLTERLHGELGRLRLTMLVVPVVALYALPTKELMTKRVIRLLAFAGMALYGCHASNQIVGDHPGTMATSPEPSLITETTWEVLTKRAPDTLIARDGSSCRDVLWKSTYVYAGTGPSLDPASLAGVAALGAGMGFDIYQVDEEP